MCHLYLVGATGSNGEPERDTVPPSRLETISGQASLRALFSQRRPVRGPSHLANWNRERKTNSTPTAACTFHTESSSILQCTAVLNVLFIADQVRKTQGLKTAAKPILLCHELGRGRVDLCVATSERPDIGHMVIKVKPEATVRVNVLQSVFRGNTPS